MQERDNLLRIFKETREAIDDGDVTEIQQLSDQTTNTAALTNDPDNIASAVVVYALAKILEREQYQKLPGWKKFYNIYISAIDKIISALEKDDEESFRDNLRLIRSAIGQVSGKLRQYMKDVFVKASINKASKLHEHGLSMERTAKLLGVTLFDLADYTSEREPFEFKTPITEKQRIKLIMGMFE